MAGKKLLSIKEFAEFSRTTRDTLLYYDMGSINLSDPQRIRRLFIQSDVIDMRLLVSSTNGSLDISIVELIDKREKR